MRSKLRHSIAWIMTCTLTAVSSGGLTSGWQEEKLDYKVQHPWDVSESSRFAKDGWTYHIWLFNNDQPRVKGDAHEPRTEMRFNPDYTSGAHQFEADMMVPAGTDNVTIMQIHTGDAQSSEFGPVAIMLQVHGGSLHNGNKAVLLPSIYGKWFHLNVIHDLGAGTLEVYINDKLVSSGHPKSAGDFYFKCGCYEAGAGSHEMQVYIKNLKLWSK